MNFLKNINQFFIDRRPRLTIFVIIFGFLVYFYSPLLFHPSTYILGDRGDGIKNYFSYAWHVQNDTSFVNYSGTNYPFGEQHAYTDGNPLLANLIKALPFLNDKAIAIFNLTLLFSIIVTALLLFNILQEFKVTNGFSILAAVGIAMLSPQTARLPGHFTLSYSFFIPLVIYLLLLFEKRDNKTKYNLLISFTVLCSFFVHPYMGMILTSLLFLYHLIKIVVQISSPYFKGRWPKAGGVFLMQSVFPVLCYFTYLKITDTHTNRTSHPFGFFFFVASIESVFVSTLPPFRHMLSQLIKIREQNWEGQAYVGISTLFAILCLPVLAFSKRKKIRAFVNENKNVGVLLMMTLSSLFLLAFSMGYPFKLSGEGILDAIPFIKQFRSPGRFAWVFYFVATISSTIIISKYFLVRANSYVRNVLVAGILILFTVEAFPFHQQIKERGFVKNCFDKSDLDDEMKQICEAINKVKPQAIIPLPFFHVGTDYFSFSGTDKIKTACFISAYHSKIPIFGNCTDRTSLDEAKLSVQLMGNKLLKKELKGCVHSSAPFCVLYSKELLENFEQEFLLKGRTILETQNFILKEVSAEELFKDEIKTYTARANEIEAASLFNKGLYVNDSSFVSRGEALEGDINKSVILLEIPAGALEREKSYEVSFWYELKGGDELTNKIVTEEIGSNGSVIDTLALRKCAAIPDVMGNNLRAGAEFKVRESQNKIRISLAGNKEYKGSFTLRNLLVRKMGSDVYQIEYNQKIKNKIVSVNNFVLE